MLKTTKCFTASKNAEDAEKCFNQNYGHPNKSLKHECDVTTPSIKFDVDIVKLGGIDRTQATPPAQVRMYTETPFEEARSVISATASVPVKAPEEMKTEDAQDTMRMAIEQSMSSQAFDPHLQMPKPSTPLRGSQDITQDTSRTQLFTPPITISGEGDSGSDLETVLEGQMLSAKISEEKTGILHEASKKAFYALIEQYGKEGADLKRIFHKLKEGHDLLPVDIARQDQAAMASIYDEEKLKQRIEEAKKRLDYARLEHEAAQQLTSKLKTLHDRAKRRQGKA